MLRMAAVRLGMSDLRLSRIGSPRAEGVMKGSVTEGMTRYVQPKRAIGELG